MTRPLRRSGTTSSALRSGHGLDVPRIGVDIVDENRASFGNRGPDQAVSDLQLEAAAASSG